MGEFSLDIGFDVSIKYGIKEIVPKVEGNFILLILTQVSGHKPAKTDSHNTRIGFERK